MSLTGAAMRFFPSLLNSHVEIDIIARDGEALVSLRRRPSRWIFLAVHWRQSVRKK